MNNKKEKILFVYQEDDEYKIEGLWATKSDDNYVIDNIPFFIKNIACGDTVSVEIDGDELYFDSLLKESGNSTIQVVILDNSNKKDIGIKFEKLGCNWEGSNLPQLISIDVPKEANYTEIKSFLNKGEEKGLWDYREACLSEPHRSELNKLNAL